MRPSQPDQPANTPARPQLRLSDWWLTTGELFQTVWNVLEGKDPQNGIRDYDFFYFDEDTSYKAGDAVIRRAKELFKDIDAEIEVRNEARVHIWYEGHFGVPAIPVASDANGQISTYAPYGFANLFARRIIPNPVLAPRNVYEAKTKRWLSQWPSLTAEPWPERKPSTNITDD
ncbi:nucleotidyltransferase family protein [Glutamicibacter sp. JL.03c]|uniref:nucleotidyltransferase family protein n=1 Tax=Glutamicibacter sp. JL.03c TaxID=2984842 RepID=UPI0039AF9131